MRDQNQQFFEQIKKSQHILITLGKSNSDSLPTALACAEFLRKQGKKTDLIVEEGLIESRLNFLPGFDSIESKIVGLRNLTVSLDLGETKVGDVSHHVKDNKLNFVISSIEGKINHNHIKVTENNYKYDLIIVIGTQDLDSLGDIFNKHTDFFYQTTIVNIDYSPANEHFGQINLIDLNVASTGEILFSLITAFDRLLITEDIATNLLASIIISTNSFKTKNISPTTLSITSELVGLGGQRETIVNNLYRSRNINVLKLWGVALARLKSLNNFQVIWSEITHEDFIKTKTSSHDLNNIIEELIVNIPNAKVIVLFYEVANNSNRGCEAIVHGIKNLNVEQFLKEFNPSGTRSNITLKSPGSIMDFEKKVIDTLEKKINSLG